MTEIVRRPNVDAPNRSRREPALALSPRLLTPNRKGPTFFDRRHDHPMGQGYDGAGCGGRLLDLRVDSKPYPAAVGTTYRIAEVAERSGMSASTLRYYEDIGLVPRPPRTPHGYRAYGEDVLDRLAFIARAKDLGCTLRETADLLAAWETDRCEPLQTRLRRLVDARIIATERRAAEIRDTAAGLRRVAAGLAGHTPEGPCDDGCGCSATPPVVCSLDPDRLPQRIADWKALLGHAVAKEPVDDGIRLSFDGDVRAADLAQLAEAERGCCAFLRFTVTMDERGVALEVRAAPDAQHVVAALFGG